jgi:hypothetical protein
MFHICFFIATLLVDLKTIIDVLHVEKRSQRHDGILYRLERSRSCPYDFYIHFKSKKEGETYSISTTDGKAKLPSTTTSWEGGADL